MGGLEAVDLFPKKNSLSETGCNKTDQAAEEGHSPQNCGVRSGPVHIPSGCHGHGHGHGLFILATYHEGK